MLYYRLPVLLACAFVLPVRCQDSTTTTIPATTAVATSATSESSSTVEGVAPPTTSIGSSSTSPNDAFVTGIDITVDDLWRLFVGPVQVYSVNTTVSPTPVPSSELIPPPPIQYPSFSTGAQNPMMIRNESWAFPSNFFWGVASAAFQVEGAVKDEGRGPCIWDVFLHRVTGFSTANETGDIANNQYYYYKQDIARIAALGIPSYSFSISWSRIFPFGRGPINEQGLAHYDDVINTCLEYGVEPIVTLYHWDLPLYLQNSYGGWLSEEIVPDFVEYARVIFTRYHDRVSRWFTVNEPIVFCGTYPQPEGYFAATSIPPIQQKYFCGQSVLLAHSQAYHVGKSINSSLSISFKTNGGYKIPLTNSSDDAIAVQRAWDFNEGWFANPIFLNGSYPSYLETNVSTFLRPLNDSEKSSIVNTSDLFAHDAYISSFYFAPDDGFDACTSNESHPLFPACVNSSNTYPDNEGGWNIGYAADPLSPWLHKATDYLPAFLHYMQQTWPARDGIALTEFGFAEPFEASKQLLQDIRFDLARTAYYTDYMNAILMAISQGVNVVGALAWSVLDNLEWSQGYQVRFGMQYCNFTTQERYYKSSMFAFVEAFNVYGRGSGGNGSESGGNGTGDAAGGDGNESPFSFGLGETGTSTATGTGTGI